MKISVSKEKLGSRAVLDYTDSRHPISNFAINRICNSAKTKYLAKPFLPVQMGRIF